MDIVPGKRLGPFVLGMPVGQAIEYVQEHEREVSSVVMLLGAGLNEDFALELREEGVRLHFDGTLQTLRFVHVYELGRLALSYEGKPVAGPRAPEPSLVALLAAFGPSYPGMLRGQRYELNYPGVGFVLPVLPGLAAQGRPDGPLEAPLQEGSVAVAREMLVFRGKQLGAPQDVSLGKITQALPGCSGYFREVVLRVGAGLELPGAGQGGSALLLPLGCGAQDVRTVLGEPDRVFDKTDARLRIHAEEEGGKGGAAGEETDEGGGGDYFFNYTGLGLDVLLDGQSHRAVKFVAHSNAPQHDNFQQYARANWRVAGPDGAVLASLSRPWSPETRSALGIAPDVDPVVHSRPDRTLTHLSTSFFGRDGLIVEVLKNNQIESVQIWGD